MKTQKFLFRYFSLAIGLSILGTPSFVIGKTVSTTMENFNPFKPGESLAAMALGKTQNSINPVYGAVARDRVAGSAYSKLSYLMISTSPGECKVGANTDLTNVPEKTFGKYTMKPVCAQFKTVAENIISIREEFFNSIPEVQAYVKEQEKIKIAAAEAEKKAEEKKAAAKTSVDKVVTTGQAPKVVTTITEASSPIISNTESSSGPIGGAQRNALGLLPGDKGFDGESKENFGKECNDSRIVKGKTICYESKSDRLAAATGSSSVEGKNSLAIQEKDKFDEEKKANFKAGLASGSITFTSKACAASGISTSECSQMKSDDEKRTPATTAQNDGPTNEEDPVGSEPINSDGSYTFAGENGIGEITIDGNDISTIKNNITACTHKKAREGSESPQEQANRCADKQIAECKEDPKMVCNRLNAQATDGIGDIPAEVKDVRVNLDSLADQIDLGEEDCIGLFSGKNKEVGKYLSDQVKVKGGNGGEMSYFSDRLEGTMYSDSSTCQEIFGTRKNEFTEIEGKLKVKNKVLYCLDVLESARSKNPEACNEAMRLLAGEETAAGEKCITITDKSASDEYDIKRAEFNEKCKEEAKGNGMVEGSDAYGAGISKCMSDHTSRLGDLGAETIHPRCTAAYDQVVACIGDNKSAQWEVALGCASLKGAAKKLLSNNELDEGEVDYQSIDSQIKCVLKDNSSPVYSLDYIACRRSAYWYNGAYLVNDLASPVIGSAMSVYKQADIQGDMQQDMAKGGIDAQTAALRAQKRQYGAKASEEAVQGTLQGAKAITMFANMAMYPTPNYVSEEWCLENNDNEVGISNLHACGVVKMLDENGDGTLVGELFRNGAMRDVMLQKGFESLSKAIVHGIIAGSYKKRKELVGDVEKALADADFNKPENQLDPGPSFCAQNPTLPSCSGNGGGGRIANSGVDFSFGGISPQGGGNLNELDDAGLGDTGGSNNAIKPSGKAKTELGDILANNSSGKFDKGFKKIGAAKVGAGSPSGGGGGGGGGASGGGGGGGGGGDPEAKGEAGAQKGFGKKTFGKYTAGSNGKFSAGGSVGKKKKSRNPFASLSGKGRNRKIASQVEKQLLPKKVQLFEVISKRYAVVSKDRLDIAKENLIQTQKDNTK
jgi:hypothetical protein